VFGSQKLDCFIVFISLLTVFSNVLLLYPCTLFIVYFVYYDIGCILFC